MAKEWAKPFYNSKAWARARDGYIAERIRIDGGLCEQCHKEMGYIVHHKIMLTRENIHNPEVALNWANFSYECKECHDQHEGHGLAKRTPLLVTFDEAGNVLPPIKKDG